jgi:hypothetical protein
MSEARKSAIDYFRITAKHWRWIGLTLGSVNIILGITAIFLSTTVASKPPIFGTNPNIFADLAYCSAVVTGILTFLSAKEAAARYTAASRTLEEMIGRYDDDMTYTYNDVAKTMHAAEAIIGALRRPVGQTPSRPDAT